MNGITARENTQQAVIALGHKDSADPSVAHMSAGLSYRGTWGGSVTGFWFLTMSNMFLIIRPYAGGARFDA